jgi:hypothetical protein
MQLSLIRPRLLTERVISPVISPANISYRLIIKMQECRQIALIGAGLLQLSDNRRFTHFYAI